MKNQITNYTVSQNNIYEILAIARFYISHYYKDKYKIEDYSIENNNESFSVDESQFIRVDNNTIWIFGIINNVQKNLD